MSSKVLVTGADGFIGSHLVEYLLNEGYEVRAFCFYNSFNSWGWLDTLPKKTLDQVEVFMGDIRDPNGVRKAMQGISTAYHLAALIGIPFSYSSPDSYVDTIIKGTLNVLQAAREFQVERLIVTSTSEVYGSAQVVPMKESHSKHPQSPYAATKVGADSLAESFYRSFELPVTIARPFNTYGPRQSARAIIPTVISQVLAGSKEIKLGALDPTRDFLYVEDTVKALVAIAACQELVGEEVNISSESEISIEHLANEIIAQRNPAAKVVLDQSRLRPSQSEVTRLCGSSEKLRKSTGWAPAYTLKEGLAATIRWFSDPKNQAGYKSHIYNV